MNIKKIIYLDPGHSATDPGATRGPEQESNHVREVCKILAPMLRADGFTVVMVPDNLDLTETVAFINSNVSKLEDGYAFAVHINANAGEPGRGAEGWHCAGSPGTEAYEMGKALITIILSKYCEISGFHNRGCKPDDKAPGGRLWFTRKTECFAGLIELCFINNHEEITKLKNNYQLIAEGLRQGFRDAFGIKEQENMIVDQAKLDQIYLEILDRNTTDDPGAKTYLGMEESAVRATLMASDERARMHNCLKAAREY